MISEKAMWKVVLPGMGKQHTEANEPSDSSDG